MIAQEMADFEKISETLTEAVRLANLDFALVNNVIKSQYAPWVVQPEVSARLEQVISSLQFADSFTQRVQHLIDSHVKVMSMHLDDVLMRSFFHLQIFQLIAIHFELQKAISRVKMEACQIENYLKLANVEPLSFTFFKRQRSINRRLEEAVDCLRRETTFSSSPLTEDQAQCISEIYTMESERVVLNWFINNAPSGTSAELLIAYQSRIHEIQEEGTIEMF